MVMSWPRRKCLRTGPVFLACPPTLTLTCTQGTVMQQSRGYQYARVG
jgi:hypothetical protein